MTEWHIRNITPELDEVAKAKAAEGGESLQGYVRRLVKEDGTRNGTRKVSQNMSQKVSQDEKQSDPRHRAVMELIMKCHLETFGQQCPWGPGEAGQLGHLLRKIPGVGMAELEVMVRNRFRSEGISPESPMVYLANLTKYGAGPLDKFGKTKRPMKSAPKRYLTGMWSPEMEAKIREANEE